MIGDYIGKICPYCKAPFREGDEIVVCSVCDMPHHKDCWAENQGCTTFGCTGTIQSVGAAPSSVTATTLQYDDPPNDVCCPRCGARNAAGYAFCAKCGASLQSAAASNVATAPNSYASVAPPAYTPSPAPDGEIDRYVGENAEYYDLKFCELRSLHKLTSWNWAAFLFAPYWLIYRKMYLYGAAALAFSFLLTFLDTPGLLLSLLGNIALGLYANGIYLRYVEKNAAIGGAMSEPYRSQHIARLGGVSFMAATITAVWYAVVILLVHFVFV